MAHVSPLRASSPRWSLTDLGSVTVPGYSDRCWWYHRQIAEALEGVLRYVRFKGRRGGYARVAISMPPQHGKSLHGTELFPAFALGQDPDLRIIVASNGATLAKKGIDNTRMWMSTDGYKATFSTRFGRVEEIDPVKGQRSRVLEVESSAQFFRTIKPTRTRGAANTHEKGRGYYLAQGLGGSITGWGYDIGIGDDFIKNAEQALNPRHLEKLWQFYTSTFATRAQGEFTGQIYIGTRWTNPDFANELIDYWEAQSTKSRPLPIKVLRFPALADGETPLDESDPRRDRVFVSKHGRGLDNPEHRSEHFYEGERAGLMTRQPWVWKGMYQQDPHMGGAKFFQAHEWAYYTEEFPLHQFAYIDFSIDAALSATGPSYSVITVTGVLQVGASMPSEQGEHYFLLDESRGHYDYDTGEVSLCSEYERLCEKWSAALPTQFREGSHWVENKALGPQLISKFSGAYPIVPVPKAKSKIFCYRIAAPVTAQQRVRLPRGTWGEDPTNPMLPLVTDAWVGDARTDGSWVQEVGSYPNEPADRRDTLAQQIICRTSWLGGPDTLGRG